MTRLVLLALNAPALVLATLIAVAIQTSLFVTWPLQFLQPDIVLLVVIWCALRRDFTEGGIITLIVANLAELHSASPQGYFLILYMLVYLSVRSASKILVIPGLSQYVYLAISSSVFMKILGLILLQLLGVPSSPWQHILAFLIPGAAVVGITGVWVFRGLERFDNFTYKTNRPGQSGSHDNEFQLDPEGF